MDSFIYTKTNTDKENIKYKRLVSSLFSTKQAKVLLRKGMSQASFYSAETNVKIKERKYKSCYPKSNLTIIYTETNAAKENIKWVFPILTISYMDSFIFPIVEFVSGTYLEF